MAPVTTMRTGQLRRAKASPGVPTPRGTDRCALGRSDTLAECRFPNRGQDAWRAKRRCRAIAFTKSWIARDDLLVAADCDPRDPVRLSVIFGASRLFSRVALAEATKLRLAETVTGKHCAHVSSRIAEIGVARFLLFFWRGSYSKIESHSWHARRSLRMVVRRPRNEEKSLPAILQNGGNRARRGHRRKETT